MLISQKKMSIEKIEAIAKKHTIRLTEFIFMPFRNPNGKPLCTLSRSPIIYCPIRRFFQQMLVHKNSLSNDNSNINPITGQVVNDDKTASTTNVQTYALAVTNQKNALKEFLGPRADDPVSKQQMLTMAAMLIWVLTSDIVSPSIKVLLPQQKLFTLDIIVIF